MNPDEYKTTGYRKRTFTYQWCGLTEVDYVCRACETIVLDISHGCQHCNEVKQREAERLKVLQASKQKNP